MGQTPTPANRSPATAALLLVAALFAGGCATVPAGPTGKPLPPPRLDDSRPLHVSVGSRIMHLWIWSDAVAESCYNGVVRGFRESGYKGDMLHVQPSQEAPEDTQTLFITIRQWRAVGDTPADILIFVTYNAGDGIERELGLITGHATDIVFPHSRLELERAFDDAAEDAAKNLLFRLTKGS